jgi:5'-3' exoribonuclease 2
MCGQINLTNFTFSRDHIPKAFHHLMTDEFSPIIDFYPVDFDVDMDGKKWEWQGNVIC